MTTWNVDVCVNGVPKCLGSEVTAERALARAESVARFYRLVLFPGAVVTVENLVEVWNDA